MQAMQIINSYIVALAIFLLSMTIRLLYIFLFTDNSSIGSWADQGAGIAINMLEGRGYTFDYQWLVDRKSFRMPGLPIALYLVWLPFGINIALAKVYLSLFSSLSCVLIYLIGCNLYGKTAGTISGLLAALYPGSIYWCGVLGPESLVSFFLYISIYLLMLSESSKKYLFASLAFGLLLLTRPVYFPLALVLGFMPFRLNSSFVSGLKYMTIWYTVILCVFMPWVVRNYHVHNDIVVTSTEGGLTWLECNNPISFKEVSGDWVIGYAGTQPELLHLASRISEPELDRHMYKLGNAYIKEDPFGFIRSFAWRICHIWRPIPKTDVGYDWKIMSIMITSWLPVFIFGFLKMWQDKSWRNSKHLPILMSFIWVTIAAGLVRTSLRYRTPLEPLLIVFAVTWTMDSIRYFANKHIEEFDEASK